MKDMQKPIKDPTYILNWICMNWSDKNGYDNALKFYEILGSCSKSYSIKVNVPYWIGINSSNYDGFN